MWTSFALLNRRPLYTTMSKRVFEGTSLAEQYERHRPKVPEGVIQAVTDFVFSKYSSRHDVALVVDVGCGSGQFTRGLASHFDRVLGFDVSEGQIQRAKETNRLDHVEYGVSRAEALPVQDGSVDVLTVSSATHWFDGPAFAREVDRVLRPGGCLALVDPLKKDINHADPQTQERLRECRSKSIRDLEEYRICSLKNLTQILEEDVKLPGYDMKGSVIGKEISYTAAEFIRYTRTQSLALNYLKHHPDSTFYDDYEKSLRSILQQAGGSKGTVETAEAQPTFRVMFWYDIMIGRKPIATS